MKIANFLLKTKEFLINRITELLGLTIIFFSASVLVSLMSYSPDDPNFIINEKENVKNLLGFRGSIIADFLFQSIGLIAYLVPFTLFFSGVNIFKTKNQIIIIENLFFCIYIITNHFTTPLDT